MFFGMAGMGFQIPTGGIYGDGGVFGGGSDNGGTGSGGGWGWADSLARIIAAGGSAVEKVAGSITGHQGQYTQQYQPLPQTPQVIYANNPQGNNLSLDSTLGNVANFLAQNIVPVGIFVIGLMLFKSGRK